MTTPQSAPPQSAPPQRQWVYGAAGFVTGLILASVAGAIVAIVVFIYSGGPVGDEWECSKGEGPITTKDGGGQCLAYGDPMPRGWTALPEGNQPLDADQ